MPTSISEDIARSSSKLELLLARHVDRAVEEVSLAYAPFSDRDFLRAVEADAASLATLSSFLMKQPVSPAAIMDLCNEGTRGRSRERWIRLLAVLSVLQAMSGPGDEKP